jgi:hypothetical protein
VSILGQEFSLCRLGFHVAAQEDVSTINEHVNNHFPEADTERARAVSVFMLARASLATPATPARRRNQ